MIYIFDKTQAIIKVLTNDDFTAAHLNFKINTATTFEFSLPASKALPSGSKYVATPHPLNDSKFIMLRLTERVDKTETIDYSAYELAYQELATDGYIEDKRPQNQSALNLMKIALDGSNWELNNVNVSGTATTNFYYVDRLSAISKVVDLLGGEIVFYIEIQGNAISGRYMDYLARQGADTSKVFASGSNLLTVERQSDTSNIYTAILPRGKGKEIDNGDADTPDGYGRRINIADVEWKRSAGKPLDKPKGSIVLSDPDATAEWGQINGNARLLLQTYDDIDDVNVLINSAYKTLQSVNHPQIQYSATVADVGGLSLGDTVLIMHGDRDLSYKTRVFEVKYDLLSPDQTELSLGDDLSSNSITSQLNSLNAVADTTSSQTQWTINQIGRPGTTYGATAPDSPKVGDIWFKYLADGGTEIYRWNGDIWELLASPTTADDIATAVNEAVTQAKAHTDEVKQGLSRDIATAKSQATSQASTAEANAKSEATSLFNQAQNYVNEAKSDINDTINALSVGGRNLLLNSKTLSWGVGANDTTTSTTVGYDSTTNMWHITSPKGGSAYAGIFFGQAGNVSNLITKGQQWAFSFDIKGTGVYSVVGVEGSAPFNSLSGNVPTDWARVSSTGTATGTNSIIIYFNSIDVALDVYIKLPKLETGTIPTDWTPAPEDVVLDYTTKDNKIKETISQYQETNDGHVSKLQTDVTTALGQIETKISQTDFNQKTGEISRNANEAKDTADKAIRTIGEYKTSNDKRVEVAEISIERTANAITEKVSKTDYDKKTGELSHDLSELKQTAEGFEETVTKVANLAVGVKNLVRQWSGKNASDTSRPYINDVNNTGVYNTKGNIYTPDGLFLQINDPKSEMYYSLVNAWTPLSQLPMLEAGKTYTIGVDIVGSFDYVAFRISDVWYNPQPINHTKITRVYQQFTIPADATQFYLRINASTNVAGETNFVNDQAMIIRNIALYNSTVESDGAPAPEDIESSIAQVKITADGINKFVRDSSGNISSDFQTALSKTSIITGSTLATSIQKQTATQISSALTDNNGKIISLINQDSSGVQIAGKNIVLDGNTTVTGDFYAKGGNFKNLNASNLTVGTLNGNQVNITNINADNIVSGAISGANLNINLNTGSVVFQKGRINSSDYTTDINIDKGYISTANGNTRALLTQGKLQLIDPTFFSPQTNPYLEISNNSAGLNGMSALIKARDSLTVSINGYDDRGFDTPVSTETFVGLNIGKYNNKLMATKIGGAEQGVIISGGKQFTIEGYGDTPYIYVGSDSSGRSQNGDRVSIHASYFHSPSTYLRTTSGSANVVVAADGALVRSSSARKYKLDIKNNIPIADSLKLIDVPLSTWVDKHEHDENGSNERYFGMIAEDLRDAGLEYLVQYGDDNEVEGINYDRVALLLIPLVKELKERIEELESGGK
ncbi:hypothetical protein DQM10_06995 [Leuconostoc mesenteroides subsp. mesenteroides]|uniref:phage tail spike protein n=1 Tax=Leuconostoc mesenteroides TaxID=1245 RepID=UPI000E08F2D9|nr:phage tail spike protein [Leuconostoc mesenteroides]RDF88680.1 hypothetical protein DQM10_06995 [Leuconostoc mesenteroides subsp. mesenteroides]